MKSFKADIRLLAMCIVVSAVCGALAGYLAAEHAPKSSQQLISEFYTVENAATMSPVDYLNSLQGNGTKAVLVDLRIKSEYDASHLVGAVNIPAQNMSDGQVVSAFRGLPEGRPIVTYCYSVDCTLSQQVGLVLSQNGIYAKHLTAGWLEIQSEEPGYLVSGKEPGVLSGAPANYSCGINNGSFSC